MAKNTILNRHRAMARVHKKYRRDQAGLQGKCVYFGKRADSDDHIPPVSIAAELLPEYLSELDPVIVPACTHCNSIIGASSELKLVDRRDIVASYLSSKKKRMLEHGKNLYESKLPILDHFRDLMSWNVYERWLFASLTHNEVCSNDEEEKLEQYEREHHEENER